MADKRNRSSPMERMDTRDMANQSGGVGSERRHHKRFRCEGLAEVAAFRAKIVFRGRLTDLSQSGCFIETSARLNLPRLTEVEVRFTACGLRLNVLARLMDVRPGKGAGFEFLKDDPRLGKSFRLNHGEPAGPRVDQGVTPAIR